MMWELRNCAILAFRAPIAAIDSPQARNTAARSIFGGSGSGENALTLKLVSMSFPGDPLLKLRGSMANDT